MNLTASNGSLIELPNDPLVTAHFAEPINCGQQILDQLKGLPYSFIEGKDLVGIDLGANVGLFALHMVNQCRRLICVEPTPSHFAVLSTLTAPYPQITLCHIAIADFNGETRLKIVPVNSTMNSTARLMAEMTPDQEGVTVTCRTLPAFIIRDMNLSHVDFVKVDIEGEEHTSLTEQTLDPLKDIVKSWYVECHQKDRVQAKNEEEVGIKANAQIHDARVKLAYLFRQLEYQTELVRHDAVRAWK